jgi:hypothetical protein
LSTSLPSLTVKMREIISINGMSSSKARGSFPLHRIIHASSPCTQHLLRTLLPNQTHCIEGHPHTNMCVVCSRSGWLPDCQLLLGGKYTIEAVTHCYALSGCPQKWLVIPICPGSRSLVTNSNTSHSFTALNMAFRYVSYAVTPFADDMSLTLLVPARWIPDRGA